MGLLQIDHDLRNPNQSDLDPRCRRHGSILPRAVPDTGKSRTPEIHIVTTEAPRGAPAGDSDSIRLHCLSGTPPAIYSRAWWKASRSWIAENLRRLRLNVLVSNSLAGCAVLDLKERPPLIMVPHGLSLDHLRSNWHEVRTLTFGGALLRLALGPWRSPAGSAADPATERQIMRLAVRWPRCEGR